jgi:sugar phosphate isomerase/epimerase
VTDCRRQFDGKFDLLLPGDGELDNTEYVRAMHAAGWDDSLTLEVSARVWSKPEYDPLRAAAQCYEVLDGACRAAGVPRPIKV